MALNEKGQPWFKDIKETLEEKGLNIELTSDLEMLPIKVETKMREANAIFKFEHNEDRQTDSEEPIELTEEKLSFWNRIKKIFE
jgi:hypothetical protein